MGRAVTEPPPTYLELIVSEVFTWAAGELTDAELLDALHVLVLLDTVGEDTSDG